MTLDSAGLKKGEESSRERGFLPRPRFQTTPSLEEISPSSQDNSPKPRIADFSSTNAVSFSSAGYLALCKGEGRVRVTFHQHCDLGIHPSPQSSPVEQGGGGQKTTVAQKLIIKGR